MISTVRLYALRAVYLMISIFLTSSFWPLVFHHTKAWTLMHGVAISLLAGMAPFMILGLRYPLKMLPVLMFEWMWKAIWVFAIGVPLWYTHQLDADHAETLKACLMGVIIVPLVLPWRYVFDTYVKASGDRWRRISD